MPTSKDFSVEDEAYLATIAAEPKMTMDEVGADIETHGYDEDRSGKHCADSRFGGEQAHYEKPAYGAVCKHRHSRNRNEAP